VADSHAHAQRLVSVVKMATVREECITEERRSFVRFLWAEGLNAKDIHSTVESVCRVKRFTPGPLKKHLSGKCFADDVEVETEVRK
jgi:hypothetical protein